MGQKDEIVWLDSPNHRFSVKVAWEQLRIHHQMVEWHGVVQECNQDIRFFYGWLSNKSSQLKIDFVGLVYMVPIDAHFVSATMKITTTCSLNAPILKRSGAMFVTNVTFQEWEKAGMNGFDGPLSCYWMSRSSNLFFDQIECIIRNKLDLMRNVLPTDENKRIQRTWRVNNIDS